MKTTTVSGRPLSKNDPIETWDEVARPQGLSGAELREKTMRADALLYKLFFGEEEPCA